MYFTEKPNSACRKVESMIDADAKPADMTTYVSFMDLYRQHVLQT